MSIESSECGFSLSSIERSHYFANQYCPGNEETEKMYIYINSILVPFVCFWGAVKFSFRLAEGFTIPATTTTTLTHVSRRRRRCQGSTRSNARTLPSPLLRLQSTYFGSIPFKEGSVSVTRGGGGGKSEEEFNLSYTLVRPMNLSSQTAAPMVVLHGGPSLPSIYCHPLANHIPYRSILFYDQLGCGKSDEPRNRDFYSIDQAVDDLETLLKRLSIRRFHLYGHFYGGIVAYEYLKRCAETVGSGGEKEKTNNSDCECLSVVLSSAPTDIQQMEDDWNAMAKALFFPNLFRSTHLCRTPELPKPLQDAYANAGTVWSGTDAILDYKARPPTQTNNDDDGQNTILSKKYYMPNALVLRGEHDVVTESCSKGWKEELLCSRSVRERTLADCSHHGLLENGPMYGDVIDSYFGEYD